MKTPVFTGTCTALITPFQASGSIDYAAFARQMDRQLESGVDALCVCGTTGESSTLTVQEHVHLVDYCVSHVAGRCKVVAGSGSNDTAAALYLCQHAQESGADALLLVTPYYNKT
ncbi:MAG: dihydrodipicolinate synthase family protein, partial [Eubacteriales bacterium]